MILGWHLVPCSGCPGEVYVLTGETKGFCNVCTHQRKTPMSKKNGNGKPKYTPQPGSAFEALMLDGGDPLHPEYVDHLPVPIDAAEVAKAASEFTRLYRQREATLDERRESMAGFKKTLDGIDEQMKPLAETVENHTRPTNVRCLDVLDRNNLIHVIRLDTGAEVTTKQPTAADLQQSIPGSEGKPAETQADA